MASVSSVKEVVEQSGRIWCMGALGVSERALLRYIQSGKIPSKYYVIFERKLGKLPRELFTFEGIDNG